MKQVTVSKPALMETVTRNRLAHTELYEQAMQGYWETLAAELRDLLIGAQDHDDEYVYHVRSHPPESHAEDYDRVIGMLSMSVDDTITLTAEEFAQYVMDQWHWKQDFVRMSSAYTARQV